ncbi:sarcosine oxidase subunit gamma [Coralliovum pocilloporae]|uniref:sarcosine oxidase subunit gamma n=1 Tax=Coralliovum pocilloporae TaxID=3066369 RepID=UPI00330708C1
MSDLHFPLEHVAVAGKGAGASPARITVSELRPTSFVQVGAWPETNELVASELAAVMGVEAPKAYCDARHVDERSLMLTAPGRYLAVSNRPGLHAELAARFKPEEACVTDLSHARAGVRVEGDPVVEILQKGIAIDFHTSVFPHGKAAQASLEALSALVHRRDETVFDLYVFRGFGLSLWHWVTDAALEYGYRVGDPVG